MPSVIQRLAAVALVCAGASLPAGAASSASSAASDSASSAVGSLSDSIQQSSTSSTGDDKKVAAGEYRIVAVTAADKPGMLRVQLQAMATDAAAGAVVLTLPQQVFDKGRLAQGERVAARHRPYGVEFARADSREAFFLVLEDAWYRELHTHAVVL